MAVHKSRSLALRSRLFVVRDEGVSSRPELSDSELIDAFERGEGRACEDIYDRLIGVVETTLFRVLGGRDANHDDLVQSAFEQIVTTLVKSRFARACSLSSWAASVTTFVAFNTIRARKRERRVVDRSRDGESEAQQHCDPSDPESEAHTRAMLSMARLQLAEMAPDRSTTLFLHDVLGHEVAEIAVLTGVSVAATQSRLVRARKELKKRLLKSKPDRRGSP